ncbi:MAG: multiheme c-type cytochrome [Planctomycetota bacterium]
MTSSGPVSPSTPPAKRRYVKAVGPKLNRLLAFVFFMFAILTVNTVYLLGVRALGWVQGASYENWFYLVMFGLHVALGLIIILPVIAFGVVHIYNTHDRKNRRAVKVGYALFVASLLLLISGLVLTRIEGLIVVKDGAIRSIFWWIHVLVPIFVVWLYVLHRLAGKKIRWRVGATWAGVAAVLGGLMLILQAQDPRVWNQAGNPEGEKYFFPSLARTVTGDFIKAKVLQNDQYCLKCHPESHEGWQTSAHRFSSFNNPVYLMSIRGTRKFAMEKDGTVKRSRWCAGCHDPVPFFSGAFNDPDYDDVNDPTAHAGITCTVCHSITNVNSNRGNSDFTIEAPIHYPFAFSDNAILQWVNEQLVKAKPEFHKKTFLKPLHKTAEFCSACHKVHLPEDLNGYKWLRGQNHYDNFILSGVAGGGVTSFYYPPKAEENCNGCHLPLEDAQEDFSAKVQDDSGLNKIKSHRFSSANTAVTVMGAADGHITAEQAKTANDLHVKFNEGVMRLDIFGLKEDGAIDGELTAPLKPEVPALEPGGEYLLETVLRTVKMGHIFTQGTADSNEVWMDVTVTNGDDVIGRSGGLSEENRAVDPWSHFVNAFVLDREGNRINQRNAQDIFTPLYSNQIPPGAADVIHYRLMVPENVGDTITVNVKLKYRKFDQEIMQISMDDPNTPELDPYVNDLPIMLLAEDEITFPIAGRGADIAAQESQIPLWQRWNDYGIGLLRKGGAGELRQAESAFLKVEELGMPDGPINLARVYVREGRISQEAPDALRRARDFDPPAREWSLLWFTGLVNKQNGNLDDAISNFKQILEGGFAQAKGRGFDFNMDYRLLNELASTLFDRAKQERGEARQAQRLAMLREAEDYYQRALKIDSENVSSHYGLKLIYTELGEEEKANVHAALHAKYKPDDNARDVAVAAARLKYPAANHAAEAVVIYDLHRDGAYELPSGPR